MNKSNVLDKVIRLETDRRMAAMLKENTKVAGVITDIKSCPVRYLDNKDEVAKCLVIGSSIFASVFGDVNAVVHTENVRWYSETWVRITAIDIYMHD